MRSDRLSIKFKSILAIALGALVLSGCGTSKEASKMEQKEAFDEAMSKAHFLSVQSEDDLNGAGQEIADYVASCRIAVNGDIGYLVLGDETGEYGNLFMVGAGSFGDREVVEIKTSSQAILKDISETEYEAGELADENGFFDIQVKVSSGKASILIGGKELEKADVPFTSLGCAGAYLGRGMAEGYMDDLLVEADGKVILSDDFDGNYVNELYSYDYANDRESVISPYAFKRKEIEGSRALVVTSGFLLSETRADCAPLFKKEFSINKSKVESAYLCMTAMGSVDATINGQQVSDSFFDPGKMLFDQYLNYVSYDVTELLEDDNDLQIGLFHGFYDRGVGYSEVGGIWGKKLAVKGALIINYKNGKKDIIPTDESFLVCSDTRYRSNDIYLGEMIDDRYIEADNWQSPEVDALDDYLLRLPLLYKESEPIRAYGYLEPVSVTEPVAGHFVYDFGENIAGTLQFDLEKLEAMSPSKGQVITFRYGELLNSNELTNSDGEPGTVWTRNLQSAKSTDYYVFGDEDKRTGNVTFSHTYHGFRYVEVTGFDEQIPEDAIRAVAISSDLRTTGQFSCSDDTINRFYDNSVRSLRSNLMDTPTDCAQRDERLGWAGDAQITSGFSLYQFDSLKFYEKYLSEIRASQKVDGKVFDVAPSTLVFGGHSCWGDAIVTIPWNAYLQYGDKKILEDNVDAAAKWVDYLVENSDDYLFSSNGYGDHLASQSIPEELTDTAWCAHSAALVSKMYKALGDDAKMEKYSDIAGHFTRKWQDTFMSDEPSVEAGILLSECEAETSYSLGLAFGLFPKELEQAAADRLRILTEYGGYLFYPGYSGMRYYLPSLCRYGYGAQAADVMKNTSPGGLAHPLSMGLTTNPETINAFRYVDPESEEYDEGQYYISCSLNHAAYSSVSEACFSCILGILPDEDAPGYEHFFIKPTMTDGLTSASGSYDSVRGKISVSWDSVERTLTCTVPKGSTCTVVLPNGESGEVADGEYSFNW